MASSSMPLPPGAKLVDSGSGMALPPGAKLVDDGSSSPTTQEPQNGFVERAKGVLGEALPRAGFDLLLPGLGSMVSKERLDKPIVNVSAVKLEDVPNLVPGVLDAIRPGLGSAPLAQGVARGAIKGAESLVSDATKPANIAILAGTAGLGAIGSGVGAAAKLAPIIGRLTSLGFSASMLKDAYDRVPDFRKQVDAGDFEGATKTATEILGEVGMGSVAGLHGAKDLVRAEPIDVYRARQASKAPSQQDLGAGGTRGPVEPEVLQGKELGNGKPKAAPASPVVDTKPATAGPGDPLARQRGEKYSDWQKRVADSKAPSSPVTAKSEPPRTHPDVKTEAVVTVPGPDIKAEVERLRKENETLKKPGGAVRASEIKPEVKAPVKIDTPAPTLGPPENKPHAAVAKNPEPAKASTPQVRPAAPPKWFSGPVTEQERAVASGATAQELQTVYDQMASAGPVVKGSNFEQRLDFYKGLIDQKKTAATTPKPKPVEEATVKPTAEISKPAEEAAKPVEQTPQPTSPAVSKLPTNLASAKPRYGFKSKNFTLKFENDLDKAAYITAQPDPSPKDKEFVEWVSQRTGLSEADIRSKGASVRSTIKSLAKKEYDGMEHGEVNGKITVPYHVGLWRENLPTASETTSPVPETKRAVTETAVTPSEPTAPPTEAATTPVETPATQVAITPEISKIAEDNKAKANGPVRIQPLDAMGKPTGKPMENVSPEEIGKNLQDLSNSGHSGLVRIENQESKPGTLKNFTVNLPKPGDKAKAAKSGERGSASLDFLTGGLSSLIEGDPNAPKPNYSGMGAIKDTFVRNLSQLEEVSPQAHAAAVRTASSKAQVATILGTSVPRIKEALRQGHGPSWEEMRQTLIESRLIGTRDRWIDLADQAQNVADADLEEAYKNWMSDMLKHVAGKKGLPQDLSATAGTLLEDGDLPLLREFIRETFLDAADSVTSIMPDAQYRSNVANRGFQDALKIYKGNVEQPVADSHALNEGVFSTALGPLDTYYPLTPLEDGEAKVQQGPGRRLPFHRPKNLNNRFTTGLAEAYDPSMEIFRDRLIAAVKANNKASLIDSLRNEGLSYKQEAGDAGDVFNMHGVEYKGTRVETNPQRIIVKDGNVVHIPAQFDVMPEWLERELRPILAKDKVDPSAVKRIIGAVNQFALAGPADFLFHSSNLMGTLVANTPFLGTSLGNKAMSIPFAKRFAAIVKVLGTNATTPDAAQQLVEMAHLGLVPERYGSMTYSAEFAEDMGAEQKRFTLGPALFGPSGVDVKARLVMYRLAKEINPDATPQQLYHFVNQLGNYTASLQGEIERAVKGSGLSPFYTAGSTMLRNGVNAWIGTSPMPSDDFSLRVWQQMTGGAIGAMAIWVMTYKAYTGQWPWEDNRARLNQIPVNDESRHSDIGNALWGAGNDVGYINLTFFNPLIGRGASTLGLRGAFDTATVGGTGRQQRSAGYADAVNSIAHPLFGPLPKAAFVGVSGAIGRPYEPYVFPGPNMLPAAPANATNVQKAAAALRDLNSFYGNVAVNTGFGPQEQTEKGSRWLHMITDLAFPNLIGKPADPYRKQQGLEREERSATKPQVEKE